MIYLDNAATTLKKPPGVGAAVLDALETMGNSARGAHDGALSAARVIYRTRVKLARLFHCRRADHVVFTQNATEALNTAAAGLLNPGDHVVTTVLEHNSVLRPLYRLEKERGIRLDIVPADACGNVDYGVLEDMVRPDTKLVVCTHASNLTGNIVDIARVGRIAHEKGALFLVDASQTAGSRQIDMEKTGIDVLAFTGHKGLMGPQGIGGMCLREGIDIRPLKAGGTGIRSFEKDQPEELPERLEAGTLNGHGIAGLSAALDFIGDVGIHKIMAKEEMLTRHFYESVKDIPGIRIYGDFSGEHAAIAALNISGRDSGEIADILYQEYGIAVRAGAHCAPLMHRSLGTEKQGAVRFSFSWFNSVDKIDQAAEALCGIADH